jgi:hypothetical protein
MVGHIFIPPPYYGSRIRLLSWWWHRLLDRRSFSRKSYRRCSCMTSWRSFFCFILLVLLRDSEAIIGSVRVVTLSWKNSSR